MRSGAVLTTLLGSCVAACLFDPVNGIAGMNHFLIADTNRDVADLHSEASRYGVQSMELLINSMMRLGADRANLRAKAFGGGEVLDMGLPPDRTSIGAGNCRFITGFLQAEGIPLLASALGGEHGRVIRFDTLDFTVGVKQIQRSKTAKVARADSEQLKRQLARQRPVAADVDIWLG